MGSLCGFSASMKLMRMLAMLLIPLLCTALPSSKKNSQKERDVLPLSYGSQMELDYNDDAYLQALAVKEEGEEEEPEVADVEEEGDLADEKEGDEDEGEVTPAGVEEAENEEDAGEEEAPAGLDFTTDIETEQEGMQMVQKIAKALKAVNKWMAGLVSYWNRIVEDSGAVANILSSVKGSDNTEEVEPAPATEEEGEDANVDSDAEVNDEEAENDDEPNDESEDNAEDDAETKADADTEGDAKSEDDAESKADADTEGDAEAEEDAETKADADSDAESEADAESKTDAETKADDELPLEEGEPDAERVMARRRNFLRKPKQMPNYVDY